MVLKTRERLLTKTVDFKENTAVRVELPQDNPVRQLNLHIAVKVKAGSTIPVGIKNGDILNIISRIEVILGSTDNIFDVDLSTYFDALAFEMGTKPFKTAFVIPAANKAGTYHIHVPIDFALIRNQISDFSALVPAQLLDSFGLRVTWGAIGDIVSTKNTATIDSATQIELVIVEVYETTGDLAALNDVLSKLTKVYEGTQQLEIDGAYGSYPINELPLQIRPIPANHLSHMLKALNNITGGNPTPDNTVVTHIKVENVKGGGEAIFLNKFEYLQRQQKLAYALENDNQKGRVYIDWTDLRNGGLANVSVDALKYKFLTAAPAADKKNAIRLYVKYIPVAV